jgi:DNA-binding NtrC family response regulator
LPVLRVLLVEDDPDVRVMVARGLANAGHTVTPVADGAVALERLAATVFDVVVCDIRLPRIDGMTVFREARRAAPGTDVVLMTSYAAVGEAVAALKEGANDYLTKPFDVEELVVRLAAISKTRALERELEEARRRLAGATDADIVGASPAIARVLDRLATVAASDAPVVISGESGTGKELLARRLHSRSSRAAGPFVAVNCAAFPETLLDAELFGYERGAFTGATRRRDGRFKAADRGTLFLDELAELPLSAQAKLLRVVQDGFVEPLGTNARVRVDARLVSATNRDLKKAIAEGRFREDLYYRLHAIGLHLPPLRERPGDLPLLVSHFLTVYAPAGERPPNISLRAWQALAAYPFPGNVRELAHAIQHAVILARGGPVHLEHLPDDIARVASAMKNESQSVAPLALVLRQTEREHLLRAVAIAGGKRSRAAELLGISRKNLWEKLRAHGLSDSDLDESAS